VERHVKGAFVAYRAEHESPATIVFQFNPETLSRSLSLPESHPAGSTEPAREVISFTMLLDAVEFSDEHQDPDVAQIGLLPIMSALEQLINVPEDDGSSARSPSAVLFCWGPHRLVPVQLRSLVIKETQFGPTLAPVRATVDIVLDVISSAEAASHPAASHAWTKHLQARQSLAKRLTGAVPDYITRTLK
jgi:hypothetical protein